MTASLAPARTFTVDALRVDVFSDRTSLGQYAADLVAGAIRERLAAPGNARVVFASAASQDEFVATLQSAPGVDWSRVEAFHMDEYLGLPPDAPQSFGQWLQSRLFDPLPFGAVHLLNSDPPDVDAECTRYEALLIEAPLDVVCLGIGENGHLAFNDPPVADFDDDAWVKRVEIDDVSRHQQVHDGAFASVDDVPRSALTLTIPALLSGRAALGGRAWSTRKAPRPSTARSRARSPPSAPPRVLRRCPHARLLPRHGLRRAALTEVLLLPPIGLPLFPNPPLLAMTPFSDLDAPVLRSRPTRSRGTRSTASSS